MAPAQTGSSLDNILDLTLSSPEPDERPRPQAQARAQSRMPPQQARLVFERESRPYNMSRLKNEDGQPAASMRNPVAPQQINPQQINPEHLREIIRTTSPHALETALLNFCRMSPALSHALVRALAPDSAAAQTMINQHLANPVTRHHEIEDESDDVYARMKKCLAPPKATPGPSGSRHVTQSHMSSSSHLTPPPPRNYQSMPRMKQEMRSVNTTSDSDDDLRLPGAYPRTAPRPPPTRTLLKNLSSSSAAFNRTPNPTPFAQRLTNAKTPVVFKTKICTQCRDPFEGEDAVCLYHTGKRTRGEDGSIIWDCCHEDGDFPGCQPGIHTTEEQPEEEAFPQRKRPSASPTPGSVPQKRPRI
jgi:hypothetical protein